MKRSIFNQCVFFSLVVLVCGAIGCQRVETPVAPETGAGGQGVDNASSSSLATQSPTSVTALPNLRVEGIQHTASCGSDGTCSVVFYSTVYNRGTGSSRSFVLGMRGWGTPTISTCTGTWQATNTTTDLLAGSYRTILIYGPGYVGARVRKGTYLTVTSYADAYCAVSETSESDNSLTRTIRVGY